MPPPEPIFPCPVEVVPEGNILPKSVFGRIFKSSEYPVISPAIEIHSLVPRYFSRTREQAQSQLGIMLGPRGLLALTG
tara:strand:- start:50 stop:283 length:234 start_codon:yes stop_codon:yes gene_type:complete